MINPRNQEICKSQREITIFLFFCSGKSLFSCFFWRRRPSKPGNLQITTGDHYFLVFLEWKIIIFLLFLEATTLETRKSANHNGTSLFSCVFGVGNHYFLAFLGRQRPSKPGNLQITTGDHYFLAFFEWEITIFLLFFAGDRRLQKKARK